MGTCYYLQRDDGKLFDLDKAYGFVAYFMGERMMPDDGFTFSLGDDVDLLEMILEQHQPYPCGLGGIERKQWAERLILFAQGKPVTLYSEHNVPESDEEYGRAGYLDRVIAERFPPYRIEADHS